MSRAVARCLLCLLAGASAFVFGCALAQGAESAGPGAQGHGIFIDPSEVVGQVGPYVYGANYGPLSAIPVDLFDEAAAAGIEFLRFPGGSWGDRNDLRESDIDMLMTVARLVGAEVSIQARLPGGTPAAAAELVRYANLEKGYGVRHWYVGNEPSLYPDYDVATYNEQWRAVAEAMLAVDPSIQLVGPEPHQWTGLPQSTLLDRHGVEWVEGFLAANGDLVDVVAVHRYPFPRSAGDPGTTVADLRENTLEWAGLISRLRAVAERATNRDDLLFAVTEVNSHWSGTILGEATNDSSFNAIWWADVLGKLIYDGAYMVNFFDLQSSDARGGWGLLSNGGARPSYYVYQLYRHFGDELLAARSSAPFVSVYASRRADGQVAVLVTNLNDEPRELSFGSTTPLQLSQARLLDETHLAAVIDSPLSPGGGSLSLPPRSATLLLLTAATP